MDSSQATVVEGPARGASQQQPADLRVLEYRENSYKIRYSSASDTLVRVSVPYAPGWKARVDGIGVAVTPADYAFLGVTVPAGEHDLTLEFGPNYALAGGALSGITALALIFLRFRRSRPHGTTL
jgi:uncharacterized membrane protein YfhO